MEAKTEVSLRLFGAGRLPVLGEWYALPLAGHAGCTGIGDAVFNEIFHPISRRPVAKCDGCLRIGGPSTGADQRVELARQKGKAVYFSLEEMAHAELASHPRHGVRRSAYCMAGFCERTSWLVSRGKGRIASLPPPQTSTSL